MKSVFLVLMTVGTGFVGGGIKFVDGLTLGDVASFSGGVISGATIGVCYNIETAKEQGLLDQKEAKEVVNKVEENLENKLQEETSDSTINVDDISCKDVLENSNV